jgi:hypothetical protein
MFGRLRKASDRMLGSARRRSTVPCGAEKTLTNRDRNLPGDPNSPAEANGVIDAGADVTADVCEPGVAPPIIAILTCSR